MGKLVDKVSTAESYGKDFAEAYSKINCEKGQGLNKPSDANPAHMIWNPKLKPLTEKQKEIPKEKLDPELIHGKPEDWIPAAVQPVILIAGKSSSEIKEQLGKIDGEIAYLQGKGPKPTQQKRESEIPTEPEKEPEPEPTKENEPDTETDSKDENQDSSEDQNDTPEPESTSESEASSDTEKSGE